MAREYDQAETIARLLGNCADMEAVAKRNRVPTDRREFGPWRLYDQEWARAVAAEADWDSFCADHDNWGILVPVKIGIGSMGPVCE